MFAILVVLVLAWGAFAFGAVYEWAYVPLLWACAAIGLLGLLANRPPKGARPELRTEKLERRSENEERRSKNGERRTNWPVAGAVSFLAAMVGLQLIPLAPETLARISPAADRFLVDYDVYYAAARAADAATYRHALSIDPAGTWLGLACIGAFGVLMVGVSRGLSRRSVRALAAGLVILGAVLALVGIIQSGLGARDRQATHLVYGFWKPIWGTSPFGPFVNRNHFAGWMLLALPVAVGYFCALVARGMRGVKPTLRDRFLWFSTPDASRAILAGLAVAVMGLSLVLTLSRSGIGGFLLAVSIAAWFVMRRQGRGSRRAVTLAYLALLVLLSVGWAGLDSVVQRFAQVQGSSFGGRVPIWGDTMKVARDFPLTGAGLNTLGTSMLRYQEFEPSTRTLEAHNDYLQLLAEGGALLAIPAIAALFVLAREIRRRFREGRDDQTTYWLRVGAATGLVAIGLQETVEFSLQIPGIAALFAVVAAIALHEAEPR